MEAYDVVRKNSSGKIWLIGGTLCRGLSEILYGIKNEGCDFDFIVEEGVGEFDLPGGGVFRIISMGIRS